MNASGIDTHSLTHSLQTGWKFDRLCPVARPKLGPILEPFFRQKLWITIWNFAVRQIFSPISEVYVSFPNNVLWPIFGVIFGQKYPIELSPIICS